MLKSTEPTVASDRDGIHGRQDSTDVTLDEAAISARLALAARLAGSDLDAESLEMITAALTAEVCDEINAPDA